MLIGQPFLWVFTNRQYRSFSPTDHPRLVLFNHRPNSNQTWMDDSWYFPLHPKIPFSHLATGTTGTTALYSRARSLHFPSYFLPFKFFLVKMLFSVVKNKSNLEDDFCGLFSLYVQNIEAIFYLLTLQVIYWNIF